MSRNPNAYCHDWHQCSACGCTRPDAELRKLRMVDDVLKLEDDVYRCVDVALCARLDAGRREMRARELGLSPEVPIRERSGK